MPSHHTILSALSKCTNIVLPTTMAVNQSFYAFSSFIIILPLRHNGFLTISQLLSNKFKNFNHFATSLRFQILTVNKYDQSVKLLHQSKSNQLPKGGCGAIPLPHSILVAPTTPSPDFPPLHHIRVKLVIEG